MKPGVFCSRTGGEGGLAGGGGDPPLPPVAQWLSHATLHGYNYSKVIFVVALFWVYPYPKYVYI